MALKPITHIDPSPVPDVSVPQGESAAPAGAPNVDDKSPEEIEQILGQMNQGGQPAAPTTGLPPALEDNKPEVELEAGVKPPEELVVPEKYKNPDGTTNWQNVLKSNLEQEKHLSQHMQIRSERNNFEEENKQLMQMMEEAQEEIRQLRSSPSMSDSQSRQGNMTDEEIEEYNANPKATIDKIVERKLSALNQKVAEDKKTGERDRLLDFKINMAKTKAENNPMFKDLKDDATKILNSNILDYHPDAVNLAYHAARSIRMPEIVAQAKNAGFNEGYEKHKSEMTKHVEGGGGSTLPAGGAQLNDRTLDGMSIEDMVQGGLVQVDPTK